MTVAPSRELRSLIDGEWRDGAGDELMSINPARPAELVAGGRAASVPQAEQAIAAASAAAGEWRRAPHHERAAVLRRAAATVRAQADEWGRELTREEGKLLTEGVGEVLRSAQILDYFAAEADQPVGEVFASPRAGETILVNRRPLGVVGVITPFNFPIAIPAWKIAPALVYGNTVVWKPADAVPLLAQRLAEALVSAGLPPGVLNLLPGGVDVAQTLVAHGSVDAVTFTGSTAVGRAVIAQCGQSAKPVQAEMGGNNATIVLDDADVESAVSDAVAGAFRAGGQRCTATSRLIVQSGIADRVIDALVARVDAMTLGDPCDDGTDLGPVITAAARERITAAIDAATGAARLLTSPNRPVPDDGYFVAPHVVELPDAGVPVWREEVFGPLLTLIRAGTADEAFALAEDSEYGLSCSVFTNDLGRVTAAMDRIRVGVLHVNSETGGADPHVPFGGAKGSGYGPKEQGRAAREFFTYPQTTYLRATV